MECKWCGEEGCGPAEVVLSCGCTREQCSSDATENPGEFCAACDRAEERARYARDNRPGSGLRSGAEQ